MLHLYSVRYHNCTSSDRTGVTCGADARCREILGSLDSLSDLLGDGEKLPFSRLLRATCRNPQDESSRLSQHRFSEVQAATEKGSKIG